jgi:hypothetical protein
MTTKVRHVIALLIQSQFNMLYIHTYIQTTEDSDYSGLFGLEYIRETVR